MPYCEVVGGKEQSAAPDAALNDNGIKIFYRTYGRGPTKVILITGLAGTHDAWGPQLKGLAGTDKPNDDDETILQDSVESGDGGAGIEVCAFDNRGMGRSSVPVKKTEYTTKIMAKDVIALMDHLGWKQAHVFGHSMGAMIACKLAAMVPERVLSLALLNVTGGGFQCCPKVNQALIDLIKASEKKISPQDWTNLPQTSSGVLAKGMSFVRTSSGPRSYVSGPLEKLHLYLLYLCGLFLLAFEYARRLLQSLKPVRVRASPTSASMQ